MKIIWGNIRLRCHGAYLFLCAAGLLLARETYLPALGALFWHEAGHMVMAWALHLPVQQIELLPFGGVMTVQGLDSFSGAKQLLLSLGGPVFSLLGVLLTPAAIGLHYVGLAAGGRWIRHHLLLFLMNLLPVLPLDGGRIAFLFLSRFLPRDRLGRVFRLLTYAIAAFFCGLSLLFALRGQINMSPAFAGLFMVYAFECEERKPALTYVSGLIQRRMTLDRQFSLPVEHLAVRMDTPCVTLLRLLDPRSYHEMVILSPDGLEALGRVSEKELVEKILADPEGLTGDLLSKEKGTEA